MSSNFDFLEGPFPSLANLGRLAETYIQSDPNSSLMKQGMIGESIVNLMFDFDRVRDPYENTAVNRINTLTSEGLLPRDVVDVLHLLRKARNKAAHDDYGTVEVATQFLPVVHSLCGWFTEVYGPTNFTVPAFVDPAKLQVLQNTSELEAREEELAKQDQHVAIEAVPVKPADRRKKTFQAANQRPKTEAETRLLIDEQLRLVGWEADTAEFRYSKGTRPMKGRNIAIAEWPTGAAGGRGGRVDYALFIGKQLIGIIEAKATHKDIPAVLDYQGKDYPRTIREQDHEYVMGRWGEYRVPFTFATNGRPYLEQYKTKSGVWFQDLRNPLNTPRALQGWMSPQSLLELYERDILAAQNALDNMSDAVLEDPDGLNLRDYQIAAIKAAEHAIADGQTTVLLAMATGTGKTRTVLGMIYRFLKSKRFHRILFLVDRTSLGDQAADTFRDVKLEELMPLDDIYNIKGLEDTSADPETRLHISTVQGMVKRVFYPAGSRMPAVGDYDLIIVDEAHRGYLLDKEMTDDQSLYRDQLDYQSTYRKVMDYFDATKIALTATPALHTTEIFGQPIYTYTYREAVMDGWLVDHDAPHKLTTKLSTEGINFHRGETVPVYDPDTGEITNSGELADELSFDVDKFNRQVITEDFNRTVLTEIARNLDPESPEMVGKTLIYAVDNAHADMIVAILKEIYSATGVDNDAIQKITSSVGGGDRKKISQAIKHFKNERFPSVVVTVDLLTTGIDVPAITTLVFMRRVRSRILFEQMLGRATRLCPDIAKSHFEIYDPVGVYEALDPVNTMKPVTAGPTTTFVKLLEGLEVVRDEDGQKTIIDQIAAKLQRRKHRLTSNVLEHITALADGKDPDQILEHLKSTSPEGGAEWAQDHRELFTLLDEVRDSGPRGVFISDKPDELLTHTRNYGAVQKPSDYIDEFTQFVRDNVNEIAALKIVCTRPADLTRGQLRSLKLVLDRAGFTERALNGAVSQVSNHEITADIISLVRRYAIGSPLISHKDRVRRAVEKLKETHNFSRQELSWLSRIEQYLQSEPVLSQETFDTDDRFRTRGGFGRIDMVFSGNLGNIVSELNEYLYEDEGVVA